MSQPQLALFGQVALLSFVYVFQTKDYYHTLELIFNLAAWVSSLAVGFVSLFCVTVLSGDITYLFVRLLVPEQEVWKDASRPRWMLAWAVTWIIQIPFWFRALPRYSPLLLHELVNLVLTIHNALLLCFSSHALPLPSATLLASTENTQRASLGTLIAARCLLPLMYVLFHGLPTEWVQISGCFMLDVAPTLLAGLIAHSNPRVFLKKPPWDFFYPPSHSDGSNSATDDECELHGSCSICLSNICTPGGGTSAAGVAAVMRHRVAPGLSAARLRPAINISASRTPAEWFGGRIATTKCGHSFHARCLSMAVEALPRCPQCRSSLSSTEHGLVLPDEEVLDAQMMCLTVGFCLGGTLLTAHRMLPP